VFLLAWTLEFLTAAGFAEGLADSAEGLADFAEGLADFAEGLAGFAEGLADFAEGLADFAEGLADSAEGLADFTEGAVDFTEGAVDFTEGAVDFTEGAVDFTEGLAGFAASAGSVQLGVAWPALWAGPTQKDERRGSTSRPAALNCFPASWVLVCIIQPVARSFPMGLAARAADFLHHPCWNATDCAVWRLVDLRVCSCRAC